MKLGNWRIRSFYTTELDEQMFGVKQYILKDQYLKLNEAIDKAWAKYKHIPREYFKDHGKIISVGESDYGIVVYTFEDKWVYRTYNITYNYDGITNTNTSNSLYWTSGSTS
jgi:hypothetical protein